jgi:hypothetical protein
VKKYLPWIVSVLIIIVGLANFATSIIAGLLLIIAGLLIAPPALTYLSTIKQLSFLIKFGWLLKVVSIIFVLIAMSLVSSAEKEKLIATYNSNPAKVADEVRQALGEKNYNLALVRVEKYLKVLPNNPELKLLQQEAETLKTQAQK